MAAIHIIGAGLAGLSCALSAAERGIRVCLYEATTHAGGRCRSFHDPTLDRVIDNGNHLILGANTAALSYIDSIGARGTLDSPAHPEFPFIDLGTGARWTLKPNLGRVPWWIAVPGRRVAGSQPIQYLSALKLARAGPDATIADCLDSRQVFFRRFYEPFTMAILNAAPDEGAASLLWAVISETFGKGGRACRPFFTQAGLSASFVDPAVARLQEMGVDLLFGHRLRHIDTADGTARSLDFRQRTVALDPDDQVVLALPPTDAAALLPGLRVPQESRSILNLHFRLPNSTVRPNEAPFLGLIGSVAHWVFMRGDVASVTVSAADHLVDESSESLAARLWPDVARALGVDVDTLPPSRVVKERRATFAQTPAQLRFRSGPSTPITNMFLAGDWTDTGLPATIEGAIRSGRRAADLAVAPLMRAIAAGPAGKGSNNRVSRPTEWAA